MKLRFSLLWLAVVLFAGKAWSQANNDNFAGRLALSGTNVTAVSSLQAATHETGEPNHANYSGSRSLWWTWTAPATGTVNFSTSAGAPAYPYWYYSANFTRALAVYTGNSLPALTEIANAGPPSQSTLVYTSVGTPPLIVSCNVQVTAGTVYQIAVDGPPFLYPGDDGTVSLAVNQSPTIYSTAGASGTVGTAFSYTIQASSNPTSFDATGLPPGLSVNPSTGAITGTPSAAGTYTVGLSAVNPGGTNMATLTLAIVAAAPAAAPSAPVISSGAAASGTVGAVFSYYISASNGVASYTASNLPPGLSIDVSTGQITGVPTVAGTTSVPVTATNAVGTGSATVTINVAAAPAPPVITSALTASGTVGSTFSYYIYTSTDTGGTPTGYGASNLPPGLGFDPTNYVIKGTPSAAGTYSVPITATNAGGTGSAVVTIVIAAASAQAATPAPAAPQLSSSAFVTATVGTAFSYALTANNAPTSYAASNLPPGLSINPATGYITGTPVSAGVTLVPVSASNAYGESNATLTISVFTAAQSAATSSLPPAVITSPASASGTVGQYLSYTLAATSGNAFYPLGYGAVTYAVANLPPGLSLNTTLGIITGTPTTAGTYATTITATPSYFYSVSKGMAVVTFVVRSTAAPVTAAPVFTSAAEVTAYVGATFPGNTVFVANGSPTSYSVSGLPPGLSVVTAGSNQISGSPTTAGTYPVTVSATNSVGTGTATVTFVVTAQAAAVAPVVTSYAFNVATLGASFYYSITSNVSITSCSVGTLPPGLSFLSGSSYAISGTPTALGLYQVPLSVVTPSGTVNATLTINVLSAVTVPVITSAAVVRGTVGSSLSYTIAAQAASNNPTDFAAGTPPPGMTYSNGSISGTPTTVGVYRVPISATTGAGTTNATVTFTITAPVAPTFSGSAVASGTVGTSFSYSVYAYNSPTSYTASNLPPGISFSGGTFSGTPTTVGTYAVPISAANAGGTTNATLTVTIANPVVAPPVISSAAAATGLVKAAFSYTITATNSPTSFDLGASTPPGLSFNPTIGALSGTPTTAGTYTLPVTATNAGGAGHATVTLIIAAQPSAVPVITSSAGANFNPVDSCPYYITASNQPTSYGASGLPSGLTLNPVTGLISGTLANSTTFAYAVTITATNSVGQGSATLMVQSASATARITSGASAGGVIGTAFSYNITTNYAGTNFSASGLPPGLSLNTSTGLISGNPTVAGTYTAAITAGTNGGGSASGKIVITITAAASSKPQFTSASSAYASIGDPFYYYLSATNSPTSFSVTNVPPGLNFDSSQGLISGAPTTSGTTYSVGLSATNAAGTTNATLTFTVLNVYNGSSRISSAAGASATVGVPFSYTLTLNKPLTYTVSTTNLPPGLGYNASTQTITGTPTVAGTFATKLSADTVGYPTSGYLTINVAPGPTAPPVISSAAVAASAPGAAFSYTLAANNLPTSFSATNLPSGLSLDPASGIISGVPTAAGTSSVPVSATNAVGTGSATLTLVFAAAPPSLAGNSLTASTTLGYKTVAYRIAATNAPTSYAASGLPPGLSLDTASGAISGTPTAAGTYPMTISAVNAYGSASAVVAITISSSTTAPLLSAAVATLTGTVGASFSTTISASGNSLSYAASGLPPGLTLSTATGEIFGTPTTTGAYPVTVSAVNTAGSDSAVVTLLIASAPAQPPSFSNGYATAAGSVGASFTYTFYTSSAATCVASGLPPGLSFILGSGSLRGTPTTAGVYPVTFTLGNANGTVSAVVTVVITNTTAATPIISSAAGAAGSVGTAFRYDIAASNATPTGYGASGLPGGLQVDPVTGVISGTPTVSGTYSFTITATNSGGTGSAVVTLQIAGTPPVASTAPLVTSPAAVYYATPSSYYYYPASTTAFAYTITASGTPTSFGASNLPSGLSLNPYTGVISGTPTTAGTFAVPISATNAAGTGSALLTILIPDSLPALQPALATNTSVGASLLLITNYSTSAYYVSYATITDPTTYTAVSLPPGLSLKSTTGDITGSPSQAGVFSTTITAINRGGTRTAVVTFNVAASAAPVTPVAGVAPTFSGNAGVRGIVGVPLSYYLYGSTSYAASGLPAGLALDASVGRITGTPTVAGTYTVPVSTTNSNGTTNATLTINIAATPATPIISSSAAASTNVGAAFSYSIYTNSSVSSATPTSYGASNLPPGLSLDTARGYFTGTPTTAGIYSVPISASAVGTTGNAVLTINVLPGPAVPVAPAVPVFSGAAGTLGFTANSYLFVGTGGFTPDAALPSSLVFNSTSGSIAGLPDTAGNFDVPLSAANAGGTGHAVVRLRVVAPGLSLPRIVGQPVGQTRQQGQSVTLNASVVGVPSPTFQWWHDGVAVPGATSPTLNLATVQPSDAGAYTLVASNSAGRAGTATANLFVTQTYAGWQSTYFTPDEIAAGLAGDTYDFDGDGLPNLLDYALGRDPVTGRGGSVPTAPTPTPGNLQLQFTRDTSKTDLIYTVEASGDLLLWTAIARSTAGSQTVNLGGAGIVTENASGGTLEAVTVQDGTPLTGAGSKRFLRLRVSRP